MIQKFKNYTEDLDNKRVIDDNAYLDNTYARPNNVSERYQHILKFVIPYHENKIISTEEKTERGSAYVIKKNKLKFDKFEGKVGSLGRGLLRRSSIRSAYVFEGKIYTNDEGDFNRDWFRSMRENIPFYVLKYVTIKNGEKRYSESGLDELMEYASKEFPELIYSK